MVSLYYSPNSCALASHILLEEVHANYSAIEINFNKNEQRQSNYLSVNAKGRVPALLTDEGVLTETPAILLYIAQKYPQKKMAPLNNVYQLAKAQEFNCYLCSTAHVAHAHLSRGSRWADDPAAIAAMTAKVPETVSACFSFLESGMPDFPWVLGEDYSICDPYLFTVTRWLKRDGVDRKNFPRIDAHYQRMKDRIAVRNVINLHSV